MYKPNYTRSKLRVILRSHKMGRIDIDLAVDTLLSVVDNDLRLGSTSFLNGIVAGCILTLFFLWLA